MQRSVKFGHQFVHTSVYASHLWLITGQFSILVNSQKKLNDIKHREYAHTWLLSWIYNLSWKACSKRINQEWLIKLLRIFVFYSEHPIFYHLNRKHCGSTVKCSKKLLLYILLHILSALNQSSSSLTDTGFHLVTR